MEHVASLLSLRNLPFLMEMTSWFIRLIKNVKSLIFSMGKYEVNHFTFLVIGHYFKPNVIFRLSKVYQHLWMYANKSFSNVHLFLIAVQQLIKCENVKIWNWLTSYKTVSRTQSVHPVCTVAQQKLLSTQFVRASLFTKTASTMLLCCHCVKPTDSSEPIVIIIAWGL